MRWFHASQIRYFALFSFPTDDHNRVPLNVDKPGEPNYINASFIKVSDSVRVRTFDNLHVQ